MGRSSESKNNARVPIAVDHHFSIHVRTVTGLEGVLAEELTALGAKAVEPKSRLVVCEGDLKTLYQANLWCRTAIRVLRPISTFMARNEAQLYEGVRTIDWKQWLSSSGTLAVDSDVRSSFTTHSLFLSQLTKDAIVDQFRENTGQRPSVDLESPDLRVVVSLFQDSAQIYLDSSGDSLHKRGYRKRAGEAPISETLAAGILKLSGWNGETPLLDPMCGSGTFCIEAALLATNTAPGLFRKQFAYEKWPDFDRSLHDRLVNEAKASIRKTISVPIQGVEILGDLAQIARENVERAGMTGLVKIQQGDFFVWDQIPTPAGTLLMNPPYDERLPVDNVAELYQRIGLQLKHRYAGWKAMVLAGNLESIQYIGLRSSSRTLLYNGSMECRLLEYEIRESTSSSQAPNWRRLETAPIPTAWQLRADTFSNRLRKNLKHLGKWARRNQIECWRVYDWDIPELAYIVDIYNDRLHFSEIERNHDHSALEHTQYIDLMLKATSTALGIDPEKIYFKKRKPQKSGGFQYSAHAETKEFIEVTEAGHRFLVNLSDYLDVGLFLDHRQTRAMVEKLAKGKDFLNLFAYTGSFSVYAAAGGAISTVTVDTSRAYLEWAERNLELNGFSGQDHRIVRCDAFEYLERSPSKFDLCVVDPPTRSVNRSSGRVFDVQTDHVQLLGMALAHLRPGGTLFFSTNYRTFVLDEAGLKQGRKLTLKEITHDTIPLDFERKPSHRCWIITT